jgi:recombination protein RecA
MYGAGISNEGCVMDMALEFDIITKSGSWYSYNGERLGQGRENVKIHLIDHPVLCQELEDKVRDALSSGANMPSVSGKGKGSKAQEEDTFDEGEDLAMVAPPAEYELM